jgi:cyclopropane-fatty-acyl-phospholipid synthase
MVFGRNMIPMDRVDIDAARDYDAWYLAVMGRQWRQRFARPASRTTLLELRLLPQWLTSADFRLAFTSGVSANSVCVERELLDHCRMVFETTR